ncbi:hypothetical protein ACH5A3_42435 [Streptomyces echinatus]
MAQLVREQHVEVFVSDYAFGLQESDDALLDPLFRTPSTSARF